MPRAINGRKICSTCRIEKDISEYYVLKGRIDGAYSVCKECKIKANKKYDFSHQDIRRKITLKRKNKSKENAKIWYQKNKERHKTNNKKYVKNNYEKVYLASKKYRESHRKQTNERQNKRKMIDPVYKIRGKLSTYIWTILKNSCCKKTCNTVDLIGCTLIFLKAHLQNTAIKNGYLDFDINNYDGKMYHIDHIIPVNAFSDLTSEEQQKTCFNWKNLQILKAKENLSKYNNIISEVPKDIKCFLKEDMFS